jgi:hypothetical protein
MTATIPSLLCPEGESNLRDYFHCQTAGYIAQHKDGVAQ